jgi:hypothetical protein
MTRKEEIEKQAFAVYPIIMETLIPLSADHEEVKQDCNQFLREAYINGIKWADKTMLDKVWDFITANVYKYGKVKFVEDRATFDFRTLPFLYDLKQAMED